MRLLNIRIAICPYGYELFIEYQFVHTKESHILDVKCVNTPVWRIFWLFCLYIQWDSV